MECQSISIQASQKVDYGTASHPEDGNSTPGQCQRTPPKHSEYLRDAIIGFADGLTVPFAVTAGLTAMGSSKVVIIGGLAELVGGCISMGLGAWLGTASDAKSYEVEENKVENEYLETPSSVEHALLEVFSKYGMSPLCARPAVHELMQNERHVVNFLMSAEKNLAKPDPSKAWISALVMGFAYFFGGLTPMLPYFFVHIVEEALLISTVITAVILLGFGYSKAILIGVRGRGAYISALQTLCVGGLAAGVSFGLMRAINHKLEMSKS
ncbi:DUF125-domain-containing protein [Trichodelitschia bisporula]|uniref:DUF125-domain-containing protein n=1 Tax=Trichodelitschia bisporula TaxID=703511 RepID=A0A6G1I3P6_9PEZI|nr:DUF125-domain-containing protein [Trichodelitschia bisporula]